MIFDLENVTFVIEQCANIFTEVMRYVVVLKRDLHVRGVLRQYMERTRLPAKTIDEESFCVIYKKQAESQ